MSTESKMTLEMAVRLSNMVDMPNMLSEFKKNVDTIARDIFNIAHFMAKVKDACKTKTNPPPPPQGFEKYLRIFDVKNDDDVNIPLTSMNAYEIFLFIMECIRLSLTDEFSLSCHGLKIMCSKLVFKLNDVFMTCALEEFRRFLIQNESKYKDFCKWAQKIQFRFDGEGSSLLLKMYTDLMDEVKANLNIHPPVYYSQWAS